MQSARLDKKITLQQPTTAQDAYGEVDVTWGDYGEVWASVKTQSGREIFSAGKVAEVDAVFKIRYVSSLDETWRIVYGSRNYDIKSIAQLGRQDGLEIHARAQA